MLKDKEVVADAQRQYEIARAVHAMGHGGINKTTATIAERYHWVRIKETVSLVIKNCVECKEGGKVPVLGGRRGEGDPNARIERLVVFGDGQKQGGGGEEATDDEDEQQQYQHGVQVSPGGERMDTADLQGQGGAPVARMGNAYGDLQIDPQIMAGQGMGAYGGEEGDGERDGVGEEEYEMEMDGGGGTVGHRLMEAGYGPGDGRG